MSTRHPRTLRSAPSRPSCRRKPELCECRRAVVTVTVQFAQINSSGQYFTNRLRLCHDCAADLMRDDRGIVIV